ncbi:MAG TPA: hypothetical protein VFJ58_03400 [Armatimonadota bacterium]|nr:hypothetical protein [Armatimonadota bacterium]
MKTQLFAALVIAAPFATVSAPAAVTPALTDPASVARQIQEWKPSAEERIFDTIGWARNLIDAEKLARASQRPVFLFTYDGQMAIGRC